MRKIDFIAVHCTATPQTTTVQSIQRHWREQMLWKTPGYHYLIKADGEIVNLLDESKLSNGVKGYNQHTINVCYIGGVDSNGRAVDNRTPEQRASLFFLLEHLKERYSSAIIQGHRDFPGVKKDCPCFDARNEYKTL